MTFYLVLIHSSLRLGNSATRFLVQLKDSSFKSLHTQTQHSSHTRS